MAAKNRLALVPREAEDLKARFDELFKKANKREPQREDVQALHDLLTDNEEAGLWSASPAA